MLRPLPGSAAMGAHLEFADFKIVADGGRATDDGDAPSLILAQAQNQLADKVVKLDWPSPLRWESDVDGISSNHVGRTEKNTIFGLRQKPLTLA